MPSINPVPQSGTAPLPALERHAPVTPPVARPMPVPANAGQKHTADLGDSITLGIGLAGIGALGLAAAGGLEGVAAIAAGGAVLAKNVGTAAKAFGPKIVEDGKALAERFKDAGEAGKFVAEQTSAAAGELVRGAIVGAGVSAGAALTHYATRGFEPSAAPSPSAAQRSSAMKPEPECSVRP